MNKQFVLDFQVRDSELDQYGVVNNAIYQVYLEHTRHEFLIAVGMDAAEIAREGRSLAVSGINIRYRAPLRSRDLFQVSLTISRLSGARVEIHQIIRKPGGETLILEAWVEAVFLDERARPMRLPSQFKTGVTPYLESADGREAAKN